MEKEIAGFKHHPKFSIIVPTYNTKPALLQMAIQSVINQTYKHWELCIADDGSTSNETKRILRLYRGDERIKINFLPQSLMFAGMIQVMSKRQSLLPYLAICRWYSLNLNHCSIRKLNARSVSHSLVYLLPYNIEARRRLSLNTRHHIKKKGMATDGIHSIPLELRQVHAETYAVKRANSVSSSSCREILTWLTKWFMQRLSNTDITMANTGTDKVIIIVFSANSTTLTWLSSGLRSRSCQDRWYRQDCDPIRLNGTHIMVLSWTGYDVIWMFQAGLRIVAMYDTGFGRVTECM